MTKTEINRPLDLLNSLKGKNVIVILKDQKIYGKLLAFDIHINLVLDNSFELIEELIPTEEFNRVKKVEKEKRSGLIFLRGDNITSISGGN